MEKSIDNGIYEYFFDESLDKPISESVIDTLSNILNDVISCLFLDHGSEKGKKEIDDLISQYDFFMKASEKLEIEKSREKIQAYYLGYIGSIMNVIQLRSELRDAQILVSDFRKTKYLPEFLEVLNQRDVMTFSDIYDYMLGINPKLTKTSLCNFFTRIEKYNLYDKKTQGRRTYYIITHTGRTMYKKLNLKGNYEISSREFTEFEIMELQLITSEISQRTYNTQNVLKILSESNSKLYSFLGSHKIFEEGIYHLFEVSKSDRELPTRSST